MNRLFSLATPLLLATCPTAAQDSPWVPERLEVERWDVEDGLPQNTVNALAETPDGFLWIGTWGGLVRFDGQDFEVFDLSNTPELFTNRILALRVDRHGALWIGTLDEGVLRYADGRLEHFAPEDGAPSFGSSFITEDGDDVLVADDHRAARFDGERFEAFPRERVVSLLETLPRIVSGERSVVMGSAPGVATPPKEFLSGLTELLENDVKALHVDRHGQVWVGTRTGGLFRLRPSAWEPVDVGFPYRGLLRLVPHPERGVWIAPNRHDGLLHAVEGEIVAQVLGDPETPIIRPQGLLAARDGTLWTVHGRFVTAVRGEDFHVIDLGVQALNASLMAEAADGTLWCSVTRRVCSFLPSAREPDDVRWYGPEDGFEEEKRITAVEVTRDGAVWVGTLDTLYRWDGRRFERFGTEQGLTRGYVRAFHEASDGSLWVGTYGGGLARFTGEGFVRYGLADGLPDPAISCILEDADGNLWMNSNRGAFSVRLEALRAHVPGVSPALPIRVIPSGEGNGSAGSIADGRVYFPTVRGLVSIDPGRALAKHQAPPIASITYHALGAKRDLEVRYTAPDLFDPAGLRFQHRLVGYDDEWVEVGTRREAYYTKLPAGDVTFEVVAVDSSGQRSAPARFDVSIAHAFHETTGFFLLVGLGLLGLAFGAHRLRMRLVERRNAELRQEIDERRRAEQALLESRRILRVLSRRLLTAQDEERRGIARELHDDVTQRLAALSIQAEVLEGRLDSLSERERQQAHDLSQTARKLATDVQQLSRRLHPASLTELGLVRAMRSECAAFEQREGISVRFEAQDVPAEVPPDVTLAAYRVLQESLHNVEKHARAAHVDVSLGAVNGDLRLTVVDRGQGFDKDDTNGGIGLVSMRERARAVGGRLTVDSTPGAGTSVHLLVPLEREKEEAR